MMQDINADMQRLVEQQRKKLIARMMYIGEQAVTIARTNRKYLDQTGNLTSSIGYVVAVNGSVVKAGDFNVVQKGEQGQQTGRSFATSLAKKYPYDITLIVVAGMDYATYIEAKGLGGMTAAELDAKVEVEKLISKFKKQ
jgi:hypothetical protein